jgi:monosaccharide-transporting ATPase
LLATELNALILDEPIHSIDIGVKLEVMELVLNLSKQGMSVIFVSFKIDEQKIKKIRHA